MKKRIIVLITFFSVSLAQELTTSIFEHFPLFSKLIEVDAINSSANKDYTIGILYTTEEDESEENAKNVESLLKSEIDKLSKITEIEFHYIMLKYTSKGKLYVTADNKKVNTLYVCQLIDEDEIPKIKSITDILGILSFTAAEDLFDAGLSVTVKRNDDDKAELHINEAKIKAERQNFDAQIFSTIAKVEK